MNQLPTEILDHIIFYLGNSAKDVISFSSCCKVFREELLESNPLVLALKISSDIRKLGNINFRRMKAFKKQPSFQKPKDENILKEYKRKFDEVNTLDERVKKRISNSSTGQISKAFELTSRYCANSTPESAEYIFEKWLTNQIETTISNSKKISTLKTNAIKETDFIKRTWSRLLNEYFLFQCGEKICEIISECVYQKVEYSSWNVREVEDAYPRFYEYDGVFNIGSDVLVFHSREDEDSEGDWTLTVNSKELVNGGGYLNVILTEFTSLKGRIFGDHVPKITDEIFLIVLLSLVDFRYGESRTFIDELTWQ